MSVYDERYCKKCAVCWDSTEFDGCPNCGAEGRPSEFEIAANEEMGLPPEWQPGGAE